MTVKKSTGKGRFRPKRSRTPVIAGRVPEALYRRIKDAAKLSGRTMSDEMAFQIGMAFQWADAMGSIEEAREKARDTLKQAVDLLESAPEKSFRDHGYLEIHGLGGSYFMKPGMSPLTGSLHPEIAAAITDAIKQGVAKALMPAAQKEQMP